jgi:secreted trypsin-like serine protease
MSPRAAGPRRRALPVGFLAPVALAAVVSLSALALAPAASAQPLATPRVYGGTPTNGNPAIVSIATFNGTSWPTGCTGGMLRGRLVLTASHCTTDHESAAGVRGFALFSPGSTALTYSNTGPQGPAAVTVIDAWRPANYVNTSSQVQPNDIAILQLDRDLGAPGFTRLATHFDMARWLAAGTQVQHAGYGLTGPGQRTSNPFATSLPLISYKTESSLGPVFATGQSPATGICPGDSGSPAWVSDATGNILVGEMAGGNAPCGQVTNYSNVGLFALGYLEMVNNALRAAGYPTIPSAPQGITLTARNRSVVVEWQAPATSPETVVGYDVLDASGAVVCQSATTSCTVPDLPDGTYAYTVRSRNAENEGDAMPITADPAVVATPTQLPAPKIVKAGKGKYSIVYQTLAGKSSAVVTSYTVRDNRNKVLCSGLPKGRSALTLASLPCNALPSKPGTYRFTVQAVTEAGSTPISAPSRPIRIG